VTKSGRTRLCTRCNDWMEECLFGDFWLCPHCDKGKEDPPANEEFKDEQTTEPRNVAIPVSLDDADEIDFSQYAPDWDTISTDTCLVHYLTYTLETLLQAPLPTAYTLSTYSIGFNSMIVLSSNELLKWVYNESTEEVLDFIKSAYYKLK